MQPIVIDVEAIGIPDVETYLEPVKAPENYKDPLKIAAYEVEERAKQIERAALDVDLARIIMIGIKADAAVDTLRCEDEKGERYALGVLWEQYYHSDCKLVTYNGLGYDLPLLLRRSLYLGIKTPYIQVDRFKHPQVIDLMAILSMDGKLKAHSLSFYLNRFGYPNGGPDITGADIAARYQVGDWAAIEQHCRMDVEATAWLAERIGAIPKRVAAEKAVGAF